MPAQRLPLVWQHDPATYAPARHRKASRYESYVPAFLHELRLVLSPELSGIVSDAERAIHALNTIAQPALAPFARLLLRTESIASSKVEGLRIGVRELARAEAKHRLGHRVGAVSMEVMSNIDAMQHAVDSATGISEFSTAHICAIHACLMASAVNAARLAGTLRTTQNWIGGNDFNPCGADFVPPPAEYVAPLLDDLCVAINDETLPPLVQAAIVHAQFETIHPFEDGNGRTGRALVQVVLRRRGLAPDYVPPISIVLAHAKERYIKGLTDFRGDRVASWVEHFALAAASASTLAQSYVRVVQDLVRHWRARVTASPEAPRADAAVWALIDVLPGYPAITAPQAAAATGRGKASTYDALRLLTAAGVLVPMTHSARNQVWEAVGLVDALALLEAGIETRARKPEQ